MYFTIYQTTNNVNGKIYVGMHKTSNINDSYLGSGKILENAIKKYGRENFKKEILYIFNTEEEMRLKEKELVTEEFCLREDTYNLCPGGKGGFGYIERNKIPKFKGKQHTEETKNKIRKYMKSQPSRFPKIPWNKGKEMNETYKLARRTPCPEEKKKKLSEVFKGIKKKQYECKNCGGMFAKNMLNRWHNENCNLRP